MNIRHVLEPLDEPAPDAWRAAALVAAGLTFLSVAAGRGLTSSVVDVVARTGLVSSLGPFYALAPVLGLALAVVPAGVVLLALRRPWGALAVAALPVLLLLPLGLGAPSGLLVLLGGVCVAGSWRRPVVGVVAVVAALAALGLGQLGLRSGAGPVGAFEQLLLSGRTVTGVLWAVGLCGLLALTLLARDQLLAARHREQDLAVRSAEVEEQSEVTVERARLARDLHDVVAHHVSLIAVRAETAPYTHPGLGAEARTVLAEIAADARRALDELRGVLGILGRSVGAGEDRSPQPTWGDIAALVERSSSSGQPVDLSGDVGAEVDPAVGYVAYRVVQEGLTNARKHAAGAPVRVRLERTAHLAVVTVASGGGSTPAPTSPRASAPVDLDETAPISGLRGPSQVGDRGAGPGTVTAAAASGPAGHGLVGMRERVEALGGRLVAARRDGGFVVEATLPLVSGDRR